MTDFTVGFKEKIKTEFINGAEAAKKNIDSLSEDEKLALVFYKFAKSADSDGDKILSNDELSTLLEKDFSTVADLLFPQMSDRVLAIFTDRLLGLDAARKDQQDVITKLAAQVDLVSRAQGKVSEEINSLKDDKVENGSITDLVIKIEAKDLTNNPALKKLLESDAYNLTPDPVDGSIEVKALAVIKHELDYKGKETGMKKDDLRGLSEQLSNRSKVLNDLVNEKTVTYQDFSSKYDSTIEAMAKFIEKYFQVSSGLLNRFA